MARTSQSRTPRLARRAEIVRRRHEAARRWAESASHGFADSYTHLEELCRLEDLLADGWPSYYARYREAWVRRDAGILHSHDIGDTGCRICRHVAVAATA